MNKLKCSHTAAIVVWLRKADLIKQKGLHRRKPLKILVAGQDLKMRSSGYASKIEVCKSSTCSACQPLQSGPASAGCALETIMSARSINTRF
jgi:hypothetical protein